eukprot:CAMPEP_0202687888 /NCGR_PEP_ID=MMETSP1385-20130828/3458_1 /ASSEMBLY_ACC=CAM_ASM_000861 /TAXON_ID=933848 /ORGANISM="Elphidium margaritaceum" /LENGTH=55 /DNA_ID=CAMNT_0049342741 /DNA_START=161 /DNA_END=328 /DNA_ORIENTATION=+
MEGSGSSGGSATSVSVHESDNKSALEFESVLHSKFGSSPTIASSVNAAVPSHTGS